MASSTNYQWSEPDDTSLVKNGALAIRTLGDAIDTSLWNSGYGQAGKNKVINSAMQVWQRGTSIAVTTGTSAYTSDRWQIQANGANNAMTVSRQTTSDTTNLPFIQYCARVQRNSGQTGTTVSYFAQSFETVNSIPLVGQTVSLSFYARKGANYSPASSVLTGNLISGTGTDQNIFGTYTGAATVATQGNVLTTTWQRFTMTGTVTSSTTELAFYLNWSSSGTAGTNDYFEITGVQLEYGAKATPFQTASGGSIQGELAMCQRYYWRFQRDVAQFGLMANTGYASTTLVARFAITLPVSMRVAPTSLENSNIAANRALTDTRYTSGTWALVGSTSTFGNSVVEVSYTHGSAVFAAGDVVNIQSTNTTTQYIALSAEL
jgi:hypothetical protein